MSEPITRHGIFEQGRNVVRPIERATTLTVGEDDFLQKVANFRGDSMSEVIRNALREFFAKHYWDLLIDEVSILRQKLNDEIRSKQ